MNLTDERIYRLLPAVLRIQDAQAGEPLRALISLVARQARIVEADIAKLHENQFIETCDEWVIPYLGDLLGVQALHNLASVAGFSQRARVANTLAYRRRKGTAAVLEQLAFDTTGWRARAVEFFSLLEWTQHQNHVRLNSVRTPDLRDTNLLELLNSPFEQASHTPEVRNIQSRAGRYNLPNLGIYLWRLASYTVTRGRARPGLVAPPGGFVFDPVGRDLPLFNRPQTEREITHLAEEINVPAPLRRRPLYDELEEHRQAIAEGAEPEFLYFDDRPTALHPPVFQILSPGSTNPIPLAEVLICHLGQWTVPPATRDYRVRQPDGTTTVVTLPISVAVDPVLGRILFAAGVPVPEPPQVNFSYGFSGDLGGGPYPRHDSLLPAFDREVTWPVAVSQEIPPVPGQVFASLGDAIQAWNTRSPGEFGVIAILDSATLVESFTASTTIRLGQGSRLLIVAADWPKVRQPGGLPGQTTLAATDIDPDELRPYLIGDIEVEGTAPADSETPGELILNGLGIQGSLRVLDGNLGRLTIAHSTIVPDQGSISVAPSNNLLTLELIRSICGSVRLPSSSGSFSARDSIIHNDSGLALDASEIDASFHGCTVFGGVSVQRIDAENSIFDDPVVAARRQEGCVRFTYVPTASEVPRRFRCQPALVLATAETPAEIALAEARLRPSFTSRVHGDPAYAQLAATCANEIRTGAEDGGEMGAFGFLKQPQREANLQASIEPFLRFGLEAGLLYAT